jgi:hypothetical protein
MSTAIYQQLSAHFDQHHSRDGGRGEKLIYVTGEQVISRLNDVLGMDWDFTIREHGINAEADECWALGRLTIYLPERTTTREQFGSQKLKRSRKDGNPLDLGFDLKGAATDALKKCASLVGVGLYLYDKEELKELENGHKPAPAARQPRPETSAQSAPAEGSEHDGQRPKSERDVLIHEYVAAFDGAKKPEEMKPIHDSLKAVWKQLDGAAQKEIQKAITRASDRLFGGKVGADGR